MSQANATVIDPSDDFIENTHSSRASIEGDDDGDDNKGNGALPSPFADSETESFSGNLTPSSDSNVGQLDSERAQQQKPLKGIAPGISSKRRLSFFSLHRRVQPNNVDGGLENVEQLLSGSLAVDGPSDRLSGHHRDSSRSSNGSLGDGIQDSLYGSRRDRRTVSSSLQDLQNYVDREGALPNETVRPSLPSRSTIRHVRQPSATLPPSSLRFSQAAISSSPDRYSSNAVDNREMSAAESPGLLAYPPRRRMRYRPRSQSYSYQASDEFDNAFIPPQVDGPSTIEATMAELPSFWVSNAPTRPAPQAPDHPGYRGYTGQESPVQAPDVYIQRSPSTLPIYHMNNVRISPRQGSGNYSPSPSHSPVHVVSYGYLRSVGSAYSQRGSAHSHPGSAHSHMSINCPTPSPRNLSPYAAEFVPRNPLRHPSPQLPLPPPFSATPRNFLFNLSLPTSSPHSSHTPPNGRHPTIPSLSSHSAFRIPVYDDNRDPASQPQTAAGLRRNGLPIMATQNPFNTAPARGRMPDARGARVADWQAFATPTRGPSRVTGNSRGGLYGEQENMDAVSEEDRRMRRQAATELRIGREEQRRWAHR